MCRMDVLDLLMHMLLQATPTTYATPIALVLFSWLVWRAFNVILFMYIFIHSVIPLALWYDVVSGFVDICKKDNTND